MALVQLTRRVAAGSIFRNTLRAQTAASFSSGLQHIKITFITPEDEEIEVSGPVGSTVLEVAHANKIEIEGACGGECACSTCHVIVDDESFEKLPELELEEEDMLDLAAEVTDTSRLCCQVILKEELEGMTLRLPKEVHSMLQDEYAL